MSILRYQLRRRVHWSVLAVVVPLTVAFIVVALVGQASGHGGLLLGSDIVLLLVAAGVLYRYQRRVKARIATSVPYRVEESVELAAVPEVVWALIRSTDDAPRLSPDLMAATRVDGSPHGLGERQAFVGRDGTKRVVEIVEYDEGRRVVLRSVRPRLPIRLVVIHELAPIENGSVLTLAYEIDVLPGHSLTDEEVSTWRDELQDYLRRVRTVLNPPAEPGT